MALESLSYARSVLASDVGILRHCLENESADREGPGGRTAPPGRRTADPGSGPSPQTDTHTDPDTHSDPDPRPAQIDDLDGGRLHDPGPTSWTNIDDSRLDRLHPL